MKFFHQRIVNPAGSNDPDLWDKWVNSFIKSASEAKPECDDDPRGQCRGQVINNDNEPEAHSYQEGESVDGKSDQGGDKKDAATQTDTKAATSKSAVCGKEMGESNDAGAVTEKHTEAGPGNDENPDPKVLINNDPNYQKGESVDPGKVTGKNKKSSDNRLKKISSLNQKEKMAFIMMATAQNPKWSASVMKSYVEAMIGQKIANLTEEEKRALRTYWEIVEPPDYAAEMLEDR